MRDNNFTDKQLRGLDLVFKGAKKKFPFILGWELSDGYENYDCNLYLDIKVDVKKLSEYIGMEPKQNNTKKSGAILTPFDWGDYKSGEWEENGEKSFKLSVQIRDFLNENYEMLPEDYKIYYDLGHPYLYINRLSIDYFLFD